MTLEDLCRKKLGSEIVSTRPMKEYNLYVLKEVDESCIVCSNHVLYGGKDYCLKPVLK